MLGPLLRGDDREALRAGLDAGALPVPGPAVAQVPSPLLGLFHGTLGSAIALTRFGSFGRFIQPIATAYFSNHTNGGRRP